MKSCLHFGAGLHDGEFDPGSERTLAARLKHASRTNVHPRVGGSGGRVSNTWVICPPVGNSTWKHVIIPNEIHLTEVKSRKAPAGALEDESAAH